VLQELTRIAVDAGRAIIEIYDQPTAWAVTLKRDASPVTQADLHANEIIVAALSRLTPGIPVLSEESPWTGGEASTYWAVDPLDGTREFLKRNGEFTVNIALVVRGVARLGVICAPVFKTVWAGSLGGEPYGSQAPWAGRMRLSSLDSEAVALSQWQEIASTNHTARSGVPQATQPAVSLRMVGSHSRGSDGYPAWVAPLVKRATVTAHGSSLKFCLIAQGDADLYVRMGPTCTWDTAAGQAILAAAGGAVVNAQTRMALRYPDPSSVLNPSFVAYAGGVL
jgi:3'(2'), 5'-bisphosphate nucleotidase